MLELEQRDPQADRKSITNRIRAFAERPDPENPKLIIPPDPKAEPAPNSQIPEIHAKDLTVELLRTKIVKHGSLIVRDYLEQSKVEPLKKIIDGVIDSCAQKQANQEVEKGPYFNPPNGFRKFMPGPDQWKDLGTTRQFLMSSGAAMCVESSSAAEVLLDLYNEMGLRELISGFFGEAPCVSAKKWVLRRSALPVEQQTWHQDGAFMGTDINSINLWISLSHCGSDTGAPGMDIVPQRLYDIASSEGAVFDWSVTTDVVSGNGEGKWVSPEFQPGDAIFFDHLCLHRTQYRENLDKVRYAIETWFFGESAYPKNQVPLAW